MTKSPRDRDSASREVVPSTRDMRKVKRAALGCRACPLFERATQTVMGEGPVSAAIVLVGEQPGDREDVEGHPFVGPAGRVLDEALVAAGLPREDVYLTNAVKHFKWKPAPRGKRRLHARPNASEVQACEGWLEKEIALVQPAVVVCLGAIATQALFGSSFRMADARGKAIDGGPWAKKVVVTLHPSAVLRLRAVSESEAVKARKELVKALKLAKRLGAAAQGREAQPRRSLMG